MCHIQRITWFVLLSLFLVAASCTKTQDSVQVRPKNYKVAEVDIMGSVSPDGRFLSYVDWSTGDLAVRDLMIGENRRLTNKGSWLESGEFAQFSAISPDSKQIVYGWFNKDGFFDLRIIGLDDPRPRVLYSNEEIYYIHPKDWSPDGKHILATFSAKKDRTHETVLISVVDSSVRVLKTLRDPRKMSFSADGRYIVYDFRAQEGSPEHDILLLPIDGSREITLVEHLANDLLLGWAPDGKRVLFASNRTGTWGVWLIEVADGKPRGAPELVKPDTGPIMGALGFTADGSYYYGVVSWVNDVYVATLDPEISKLQGPEKLVSHVSFNTSPSWAPNGQYLAYASGHGQEPDPFVLRIRSLETGKERELPLKLSRFHAFQPHWSPDGGSLLAQGRDHTDRQGIYQIDAQTGEVTPIVQTETACPTDCIEWPAWSPDGKLIVFTRWIIEGRTIVARDLETGQETELQRVVKPFFVGPLAVSPDGQRLAFVRWDERGTAVLKVMPATGGESHDVLGVQQSEWISALAWAFDSRHLIYAIAASGQERQFELWRISAEGGEPQSLGLTMEGLSLYGLSVHPDGRHIAFTAGRPHRNEVWVLENFLPSPPTER